MADTCFPGYSALGAGKNRYDNELTEAPEEEEEFDVLNDETFGDFGNGDFDWEEQTEKFAEVLDGKYSNRNNDSGFSTAEKSYRTQEEYMEQSISQLMVDDEEVDTDPAIVNVRKARPLPIKQQSLDMLFGPSSPPSLLDAEYLVSPTSKNIWGSPVTEAPPTQQSPIQPPVNNIQSLFDYAKLAKADAPHAMIHGPHSRAAPMILPKAQTLEEIENSILRKPKVLTAEELERQLRGEPLQERMPTNQQGRRTNGHPGISPAQFSVPPPNIGSPNTRHMPPHMMSGSSPRTPNMVHPGMMNGHRSPVMGVPGGQMPGTPRGAPVPMGSTPPYRNMSTPNRQSPVLTLARRSPLLRSPSPPPLMLPQSPVVRVPARFMSPYVTTMQNRYIATPGRGYSSPIGIPPGMRGPPPPGTPGSPYDSPQQHALYGSPQGPYTSPQQHRMHNPNGMNEPNFNRNNNINNNNARFQSPQQQQQQSRGAPYMKEKPGNRGDGSRDNRQENREHRYLRPPYNQKQYNSTSDPAGHDRGHRGSREEDEYEGIMTQKEKDWIIKIQLLQLQTENPYMDDYYYMSICMKKKAIEREKDSKKNDAKLVIPSLPKFETRSYKPAQFEGSLGRLTTSSVHNPRQIIDLLAKSVSESATGTGSKKVPTKVGKELRKSRQLLMDIEKGYNLLLDIEDLEKRILALPEDMRKPLLEERSYRIDLLFHYLLCDGNSAAFMQYMNVKKGRSLTARALRLLDKVQAVGIVSLICKNIQQLMKKDLSDEKLDILLDPCAKVIEDCNLATIVMYVEDIQQEESQSTSKPIALALQNKFGSSLLCSLLHHGEEIYRDTSPVDMESTLQNEWCEFVHDFAGILATIPLESIVAPMHTYPDIQDHLERLLNKRLMAVVEDSLSVFTHSDVTQDNES